MSNFKHDKTKPKKKICVAVDEERWEKAKKKNLNISAICNEALELAIKGKLIKAKVG